MRLRVLVIGLCLTADFALAADALTSAEAGSVIRKVAAAARKQAYSGTYFHQHGAEVATFRVAHLNDAEGELERREPLEGAARELVRASGQVSCYLPEAPANPAEVRRNALVKMFPSVLNDDSADSIVHYTVRRLPGERVAGMECQALLLEPKDSLRYGHKLCFDQNTGLLLKIASLGPRHEVIEQFAFTELNLDGFDRRSFKPRYPYRVDIFTPEKPRLDSGTKLKPDAVAGWEMRNLPAGYKVVRETRVAIGTEPTKVVHLWLSDGWGAVSVFIEPNAAPRIAPGGADVALPAVRVSTSNEPVKRPANHTGVLINQGVVNMVSRSAPEMNVVAMGNVPAAAVTAIAGSVVPRVAGR